MIATSNCKPENRGLPSTDVIVFRWSSVSPNTILDLTMIQKNVIYMLYLDYDDGSEVVSTRVLLVGGGSCPSCSCPLPLVLLSPPFSGGGRFRCNKSNCGSTSNSMSESVKVITIYV